MVYYRKHKKLTSLQFVLQSYGTYIFHTNEHQDI